MADLDVATVSEPVRYWLEQIEASQKWHNDWYEEGKEVLEKYIDKRSGLGVNVNSHRMNTLWSNVETIKPALYAKTPSPKVQRRHRDKDPVGRWAAIVIERALTYEFDAEDVDYHVRNAVSDYLLPGRGQVWQYYKPEFKGEGDQKQIAWERVYSRHIHWKDFLTNPARTWDEVYWVSKRDFLTKEECVAQRLETKDLTFTDLKEDERTAGKEGSKTPKAAIWEIWNKTDGKIYFISKQSPELLKKPEAPPLKFDGFFPVPRPLTATTTTDSILPKPDYLQYQPQAKEIDRLSQRINLLTKALRVRGIYDSTQEALGKLLDDSTTDNDMIPCETMPTLNASGGLESVVAFLPLDDIIKALQQAYVSRDQAKQVMYEVTGISDIVRGATDPNETATAQSIKSQWGGLRIRDRQKETQRFVRDILRINAEIIAEHFQLETLKQMSNVPLLTQAEKQQLQARQAAQQKVQQLVQAAQNDPQAQQLLQQGQAALQQNPQLQQMLQPLTIDEQQALREPTWEEVVQLLRDEKLRCMRIDIETDSTINADEVEEKQSRIEFLTAFTGLITTLGPVVMQQPKFAPLFGEMAMFGARAFKASETLESAIEEAVDALSQQALMPQQPPPEDPKVGIDRERLAHEKQQHQDDIGLRRQESQQKIDAEKQKQQDEIGLRNRELDIKKADGEAKANNDMEKHRTEQDGKVSVAKAAQPQIVGAEEAIAELTQTIDARLEAFLASIEGIVRAAAAPKQITVQRDKAGRISGAVATPEMGAPQGSA